MEPLSLTTDVDLNKGPKDHGRGTEAVISTKCLGCDMGHGEAGTLTLMGGLRQQPNTGFLSFFFLSWEAVRSPWRIYAQMNSGIHGKWILKAGVMSPSYSASTSQAVDRLAKLCTLTPWGMDLISSDSNATWIQSFPKPKPAPDIDGYLGIDLLGLTPWD